MAYYDSFKFTNETIREVFRRIFRYGWYQNTEGNFYAFNEFSIPSLPVVKDFAEGTDELICTVYSANNVAWDTLGWQTARGSIGAFRYGVNFELPAGNDTRVCLLRYKMYTEKYSKADTTDGWLMLSNKFIDGVVIKRRWHSGTSILKENSIEHKYNITGDYRNATFTGTEPPVEIGAGIFGNDDNITLGGVSRPNLYALATNRGLSTEDLSNLESIYDGVGLDYLGVDGPLEASAAPPSVYYALPPLPINRAYGSQIVRLEKAPDWIPVFDIDQVEDIIKFLKYGDDSGRKYVFDSENPDAKRIEDYKTNQVLYISQNTKDNNKYSYEFLNADYNALTQVNRDDYECAVYDGARIKATSSPYPVVTINKDITTSAAGDYIGVSWLGDKDQTQADARRSGSFKVWYKPKKASNVGILIDRVEWATDPNGTEGWEVCAKTAIDGGYIYTAESGETLTVYFRAITMDDINDDFGDDPDHEDDETGTTPAIPTGRGIGTYNISASQLSAINDALWSYDWNSFFKSSTIDPVKCIISCKSVPFAVAGSGSEEIVIASLRTDVYAGQVNPSYRGDTISVTMPFYRGDFTDIEYTQVRVYLPYIGWVELPASEVMSRRAKLDVGLAGNTKVLKFRYLADLVDGSCTCVVSVNGTERWLFNGHCGIDIPITSDNHTNAINNAMHAGVQTVLNIGTAAAGALTDNAMMTAGGVISAISSAANVVPTYNYSASASPGGYINAALNTHIMIVIERPNVKYDDNVIKRLGKPCHKVLNLGSLRGFTKCGAVRVEGIDATPEELAMIASGLEAGVIL